MSSPLPESWIERIWQAMRATYGATLDRQWECAPGADPVEHVRGLKAFWARELGHLAGNPDAIRYALANLPSFPPNLVEFKAVCNRRPEKIAPALPAPQADPERVRMLLSGIKVGERNGSDAAYIAAGLRRRMADGVKLTSGQRWVLECCEKMARGGLSEATVMGAFQGVPVEVLPLGMRAVAAS